MLAEVLRLLRREGSLLPVEVAQHLAMPLHEAEGALAVLMAAGLVARGELAADCPGRCGPCPSRAHCLLAARDDECAAASPTRGSRAERLP